MNNKRGQEVMGMSFGVIFSIIIIIAIIGVAVYAIVHFVGLKKCTDTGFFYRDLQDEINRAWTAGTGRYRNTISIPVPGGITGQDGITHFCFGNLNINAPTFSVQQTELRNLMQFGLEGNAFLYPPNEACDGELFYFNLEHVEAGNNFFCIQKDNDGKITTAVMKEPSDRVVTISPNIL